MTSSASFDLDALDLRYSTIFCDLWGVVHDGYHLFADVPERLEGWTAEGRSIVLITNAPRATKFVKAQLDRLGLPGHCYRAISTGGQAGIDALLQLGRPIAYLGPDADRRGLEDAGLSFAEPSFGDIAVSGLDDGRHAVADYAAELGDLASRDVLFHCLNPDRVVIHGGRRELCAGSLADAYEALGGRVRWYGKPWPAIYDHALALAGNPPREQVLAIGDGLQTDVLGAARNGFDCLFVSGGIHAGQPFPIDFAQQHGLGEWRPVGIVQTIG